MLEQLKNGKIPSLAINLSFTVKCLLLLSTTHSQLLMAKPKLLGTDNTILGEKNPGSKKCWVCGGWKSNMPQKQNDWGKQKPYRSISALSRSRSASGWTQSSPDNYLESALPGQLHLHTVVPVSSERGFIWIKSSLGKKFEEPVKVFWINSAVSSSSQHTLDGKRLYLTENKAVLFI